MGEAVSLSGSYSLSVFRGRQTDSIIVIYPGRRIQTQGGLCMHTGFCSKRDCNIHWVRMFIPFQNEPMVLVFVHGIQWRIGGGGGMVPTARPFWSSIRSLRRPQTPGQLAMPLLEIHWNPVPTILVGSQWLVNLLSRKTLAAQLVVHFLHSMLTLRFTPTFIVTAINS